MEPDQLPLRDLHLPEPVGWWPLAPGWWFLLALSIALFLWLLHRFQKQRRRNAPRRYAVRQLANIEADFRQHRDPVALAQQLSTLLRRGMLAYAPRAEVAGLTGNAWLEWLDRDLPVPYFHTEGGKSLLQLPYRDPQGDYSNIDINAMFAAVKMRLTTPVGGA